MGQENASDGVHCAHRETERHTHIYTHASRAHYLWFYLQNADFSKQTTTMTNGRKPPSIVLFCCARVRIPLDTHTMHTNISSLIRSKKKKFFGTNERVDDTVQWSIKVAEEEKVNCVLKLFSSLSVCSHLPRRSFFFPASLFFLSVVAAVASFDVS